jgi:hypothetical protein
MSAIRIAELTRLYRARYGEVLPNNDKSRELIDIVAQHMICLTGHPMKRLFDWSTLRAPWMTLPELSSILADVAQHPQSWKADSLAWKLGLTFADRQTLKIHTIGAVDCNASQRRARRKRLAKQRYKRLRKAQKQAAIETQAATTP